MKENKIAAIVDHEVDRIGRNHYRGWLMLTAVRDDADICPSHVRPQDALRDRII